MLLTYNKDHELAEDTPCTGLLMGFKDYRYVTQQAHLPKYRASVRLGPDFVTSPAYCPFQITQMWIRTVVGVPEVTNRWCLMLRMPQTLFVFAVCATREPNEVTSVVHDTA